MFDMKANNVEVGDKLIDNKGNVWEVFETGGSVVPYQCKNTTDGEYWCWFTATGVAFSRRYDGLKLVGFAPSYDYQVNKPHKHKDLIIAWANGAIVEYFCVALGEWYDEETPDWDEDTQYRIKPEPEPDVVKTMFVEANPCLDNAYNSHNLKLTFCAETGKLKAAEVIS